MAHTLIWTIICLIYLGFAGVLNASEDSVEVVMEGYESPQKLFSNLDTIHTNESPAFKQEQSRAINTAQTPSQIALDSKTIQHTAPTQWIYSTAIIEVSFTDGSFKRGLGTLLKNGFYITSAEILYNGDIVPRKVYAKMQDDFNENMMCVAGLKLKVLDLDTGLALLKVSQFVDSFCQVRAKSYYQDRIYKRFGIDVFASNAAIAPQTQAYYPYLDNTFVFIPQSIKLNKPATYYDFAQKKERAYGFELEHESYEEFTYGRAFYDEKGVFLGIMSRTVVGYVPVFVSRNVIQDFLCDVQDKGIINENFVQKSCQKLGSKRQRFFTNFY